MFATARIPRDALIAVFSGQLRMLTDSDVSTDLNRENLLQVPGVLEGERKVFVDPTKLLRCPLAALHDPERDVWCTGGFANSCAVDEYGALHPRPNAEFQPYPSYEGFTEFQIVALRDIKAMEEVIIDYHWVLQDCRCCKDK